EALRRRARLDPEEVERAADQADEDDDREVGEESLHSVRNASMGWMADACAAGMTPASAPNRTMTAPAPAASPRPTSGGPNGARSPMSGMARVQSSMAPTPATMPRYPASMVKTTASE